MEIILSIVIATFMSYLVSINQITSFFRGKWVNPKAWEGGCFVPLVLYALIFSGVTLAGCFMISKTIATVIISTISCIIAIFAYFSQQRFAFNHEHTMLICKHPSLYPGIAITAFIVCAVAGMKFVAWYFFIVPVGIWFILGFVCAELAIQAYIKESNKRGSKCDRDLAVFAITDNAKGLQFRTGRKYPFP